MSKDKVSPTFTEIENGIAAGLLSPGARGMNAADVLVQYAEANALTIKEAYDELRTATPKR